MTIDAIHATSYDDALHDDMMPGGIAPWPWELSIDEPTSTSPADPRALLPWIDDDVSSEPRE